MEFVKIHDGDLNHVLDCLKRDPKCAHQCAKGPWTPLQVAAKSNKLEIVKALLSLKELDPNVTHESINKTPLHLAVERQHSRIVRLLLRDDRVNAEALEEALVASDDTENLRYLRMMMKSFTVRFSVKIQYNPSPLQPLTPPPPQCPVWPKHSSRRRRGRTRRLGGGESPRCHVDGGGRLEAD
jgi:hypothetical protein